VSTLRPRIQKLESILGALPHLPSGDGEGATVEIGAGAILQALLALSDIGYFAGDVEATKSRLTALARPSTEPADYSPLAEVLAALAPLGPEERRAWFAQRNLGQYTLGIAPTLEPLSEEDEEAVNRLAPLRPPSAEELKAIAALRETSNRKSAKQLAEAHAKKPKHKGKP
jgi:hypothetical protein